MKIETLNEKLQNIARKVDEELPKDTGFAILVFPQNVGGRLFYMSNSNRDDVSKAMQEWIDKVNDDNFGRDI